MSKIPSYYRCGWCDAYHSVDWWGDCREDAARFSSEDLDEKHSTFGWEEVELEP